MTEGVRITGFGHAVPGRQVPNARIEAALDLEDGWIERRTGIRQRYWAGSGDTLSELAARAGMMALEVSGFEQAGIGLLILATSTPDHLLPPSAPLVAHRLGLDRAGAVDLTGACGGFIYALSFAEGFVRQHGKPALVIAANILSRRINPAERASAVLFGDAAGAIVLAPSTEPEQGILGASLASDGAGYGLIRIPVGGGNQPFYDDCDIAETKMVIADGRAVFLKAVEMMSRCSTEALAAAEINSDRITRFIPHQANRRIFDAVGRALQIPDIKIVKTIAEYGNSSAATIPLSLSLANQAEPFRPGDRLLLAAAGAGFTGGAVVLGL